MRYIVMAYADYEGNWPIGDDSGEDEHPLPTFASREDAAAWADSQKYREPDRSIYAVEASA